MNEEALNDSFNLFASNGYNGDLESYKKLISSKISYIRWSNAFMFNAMSYYLKENHTLDV